MQVFLPYPDFKESAKALDMRRLGKQRVENYQIIRATLGLSKGWVNHPVVKMWKGYENNLYGYQIRLNEVWLAKGYKDTTLNSIAMTLFYHHPTTSGAFCPDFWLPPFVNEEFCLAHQQILLKKNFAFYSPLFGAKNEKSLS